MKNTPAPKPYTAVLKPRSTTICCLAKPTFTRSMKAAMKQMHKKGISFQKLIPFLCICFMAAFMDRVNVGFAKQQMVVDLGFSTAVYGFGAGVFFIGYFLFEVPSNLIMERIGVRKTLLRIMFTWGIVATAMAFV